MLENFNEDKRKNSMAQFSDFHTGWSIVQSLINATQRIGFNLKIQNFHNTRFLT